MRPMPHAKDQYAIVQLRQGKSTREVSKALRVSAGTVSNVREEDKGHIPGPKIGRHSKASNATIRVLARKSDTGMIITFRVRQ